MIRFVLIVVLFLPLGACCQWMITLTKNGQAVTKITPFVSADTGDVVVFTVSAPANIPIQSVLKSLDAHLCVLQSQEQSRPDSIKDMLPELKKEINRGDDGEGLTQAGNTNTWIFKFKIGDLSDCKGEIIWLKFVSDPAHVPKGPSETIFQFFIKPF